MKKQTSFATLAALDVGRPPTIFKSLALVPIMLVTAVKLPTLVSLHDPSLLSDTGAAMGGVLLCCACTPCNVFLHVAANTGSRIVKESLAYGKRPFLDCTSMLSMP